MVTLYGRLPRTDYIKAETIEALALKSQYKAGGTDLVPKLKRREIERPKCLIDPKGIPDPDYISYDEKVGLRIGPLATLHTMETSPLIQQNYSVLRQAARTMASPQIRNRATVAGNIYNPVPSADTAPPLLARDAMVTLARQSGERHPRCNRHMVYQSPRNTGEDHQGAAGEGNGIKGGVTRTAGSIDPWIDERCGLTAEEKSIRMKIWLRNLS
jgi:CO/xanthine dehydrogenase FAD-binding subunit